MGSLGGKQSYYASGCGTSIARMHFNCCNVQPRKLQLTLGFILVLAFKAEWCYFA